MVLNALVLQLLETDLGHITLEDLINSCSILLSYISPIKKLANIKIIVHSEFNKHNLSNLTATKSLIRTAELEIILIKTTDLS